MVAGFQKRLGSCVTFRRKTKAPTPFPDCGSCHIVSRATDGLLRTRRRTMSLEVGDKAPGFTLPTDGGRKVSLKALKGKTVVLYFYPRNDTPGCTAEACAFRDSLPDFSKVKAEVIGISRDPVASHEKIKKKFKHH